MTPSKLKKLKRVYRAAKALIRAEWHFRLGPIAYHTPTDKIIIKAEKKLRKAVTGHSDLGFAGEKLGAHKRK